MTDFSGTWKCVEVGENFGDFLKFIGTPWFIRKIAAFDRFGTNKEVEVITMSSPMNFKAVNNGPRKVITQEFTIDGTEQRSTSIPDGSALALTAVWDGDAMVMRTQIPGAAYSMEARRTLDPSGRLRLDITAERLDGTGNFSTYRIFVRTDDADGASGAGWASAAVAAEIAAHGERPETPRAAGHGYIE